MNIPEKRKIPARCTLRDDTVETVPMHPDDFEAHLAWISAKQFSEMVLKETHAEKTVYYRIVG